MYFIPVNVAINFNEIRLISSFDDSLIEDSDIRLPLGDDVTVELLINTCCNVSFPERKINDQITTIKVLSSLINSFIYCKTCRMNVNGEKYDYVLKDLIIALQKVYDYVEVNNSEWSIVVGKKHKKVSSKKWVDTQLRNFTRLVGNTRNTNIIRNILPLLFLKGIEYSYNDNELWPQFKLEFNNWTNKIDNKDRVSYLSKMVENYISYY